MSAQLTLGIIVGLLAVATLAPLIDTRRWYIRVWDFPRLQLAAIAGLALIAGLWRIGTSQPKDPMSTFVLVAVCTALMLWHLNPVVKYTRFTRVSVKDSNEDTLEPIRVAVSNLDKRNKFRDIAADELESFDADVLVLIEVDAEWFEALNQLRAKYSYHIDVVEEDGLGLCVWSNREILNSEVRYLVSDDRPSIWLTFRYPSRDSGCGTINFVAIHPTPPALKKSNGERFDSKIRDAELVVLAEEIVDQGDQAWIVTGDFNDVAWSPTTRLFERVSGLQDVRTGRALLNTYHARYPFLRYPIDHVYVSCGFRLSELSRYKVTGSDHFAVLAALVLPQEEGVAPERDAGDQEKVEDYKAAADVS